MVGEMVVMVASFKTAYASTVVFSAPDPGGNRMISVPFQGKHFDITVIQVSVPPTNAENLRLNSFVNMYKNF